MAINKKSFVPLYHQLFEEFKRQIQKGKLNPGDPIPSESKLVDKYQLSRGTVRQAMQKLEIEKLIEKFPGRGTFVAKPKKEKASEKKVSPKNIVKFADYQSIFDQIVNSTSKPSAITIKESGKIPTDAKIKTMMKLDQENEIYYLERSLVVEKEIWANEKSYFPLKIADTFDKIDLLAPVWEQYAEINTKKVLLSKYIVEVLKPDENILSDLMIDAETPLFNIIRLTFLENNEPFNLTFGTYRGDRLRLNFGIGHIHDETKFSIKALKEFR